MARHSILRRASCSCCTSRLATPAPHGTRARSFTICSRRGFAGARRLATVGRLDRDTTGLLLLTDDGPLLHRIVSPRSQLEKVYEATLARDLRGNEGGIFASGKMMLESEREPLAPAALEVLGPRQARVTVTEGRYHQVRRMFAAVGNHVEALHRSRVGGLTLGDLEVGKWRPLDDADIAKLFAGRR
jgi:16S rRNA pseudouridine516 synthase